MSSDLSEGVATPNPLSTASPPAVETASPPRGRKSLRTFGLLFGIVLVLAGGAAAGWWWFRPAAAKTPSPPLPENIEDPELQQAIAEARRKIEEKPRSADTWSDYGLLLLGHHCNAEADFCFAEASRLDPENARWPFYRSVAALRLDPEHTLPFLRQAEKLADSLPEDCRSALRLRLAETLLERGDIAEARRLFAAEWQLHPDSERAALGVGLVALAQGDNGTATRLLIPLTRNSPYARKKATLQLALLSRRQGEAIAAATYERNLAALPPDVEWPDPLIAVIYDYQVGDVKEKRQIAEFEKQGHYRQAADLYLARLKRGPTLSAYLGAGINLSRAGDYDRALPLLRASERLDPNNSSPPFHIAEALFQRAKEERERSPDSATARQWLREAVEFARRATVLKPDHYVAYMLQGESLLLLGEPLAALEPLRHGAACRPVEFRLQYFLGLAYLESACWYRPQGYREAAIYLENARKLDPTNPLPGKALERLPRIVRP